MTLIEGMTLRGQRKHYGTDWRPDKTAGGGHEGVALCHTSGNPVCIRDQVSHDLLAERHGWTAPAIFRFPLCTKCERAAERSADREVRPADVVGEATEAAAPPTQAT